MPHTYKLKFPVKLGDLPEVTELTFRTEVCAEDLYGVALRDNMLFEEAMKVAGRLAVQSEPFMRRLRSSDALEIAGLVSGFLLPKDGEGTGGSKPSLSSQGSSTSDPQSSAS